LRCSAKKRRPFALNGNKPKSRTAVTTIGAPAAARFHITAAARVALFAAVVVMKGDSYKKQKLVIRQVILTIFKELDPDDTEH
jgi:hypothetical protein